MLIWHPISLGTHVFHSFCSLTGPCPRTSQIYNMSMSWFGWALPHTSQAHILYIICLGVAGPLAQGEAKHIHMYRSWSGPSPGPRTSQAEVLIIWLGLAGSCLSTSQAYMLYKFAGVKLGEAKLVEATVNMWKGQACDSYGFVFLGFPLFESIFELHQSHTPFTWNNIFSTTFCLLLDLAT